MLQSSLKALLCDLCACLLTLWVSALPLSGQFETAVLTGTVVDPASAVVGDAKVTATHEATNTTTSTNTNEDGRYLFPTLRPGSYRISVSSPGFKHFVSSGLVLQVNQSARFDVQLTVGAVTEELNVV